MSDKVIWSCGVKSYLIELSEHFDLENKVKIGGVTK